MKCGEFLWRPEASGLIPIICSLLSSSLFLPLFLPLFVTSFYAETVVPHVRNPHDGAESVPLIAAAVIISSHLGKVKFKTAVSVRFYLSVMFCLSLLETCPPSETVNIKHV